MRLCEPCTARRDWRAPAPTAKEAGLRAQGMICRGCGRFQTEHPLLFLCRPCAEREERCQHCLSYLTPEAAARARADEEREALTDLFTLCVKAYGISKARELFASRRGELGTLADEVLRLDHRDLDYGRERRDIWRKVLGPNVFRSRACPDCAGFRAAPGIVRAERCGHLAPAASPAYCPVCAADAGACERCGAMLGASPAP